MREGGKWGKREGGAGILPAGWGTFGAGEWGMGIDHEWARMGRGRGKGKIVDLGKGMGEELRDR